MDARAANSAKMAKIKSLHFETDKPAKQINVPVPPKRVELNKMPRIPKLKKSAPPPAPVATSGKLPKYPEGNKAVHKQLRKQRKLEYQNEDLYQLDQTLAMVVEKELDGLCNMIVGELSKPDKEEEEPTLKRLRMEPMIIFRKSVKLSLIKRLLDIRTNLAIIVFVEGKIPTPVIMSEFLRPYGVISLKKSEAKRKQKRPFFVATCGDYESYDNLCAMKAIIMNQNTGFKFKPLHMTPPKPNISKAEIQKHLAGGSQSVEQIEGASTDVVDFSEEEDLFYVDIPDVKGVKKEGDDVENNDIKIDETNEKNDGVTNDGVKNENIKDDHDKNDDKNKDDEVKNSVTNEEAVKNNDANEKDGNGVKNNDTNIEGVKNATNKDDEAFEEDEAYDVDDGEDYFMMDGEEYRVEDEITDIKETDLEDY